MTTMLPQRTAAWPASLGKVTAQAVTRKLKVVLPPHSTDDAHHSRDSLVYFHRSEVQIGEMIGKGGFSEVYEITSFRPKRTKKSPNQVVIRSFYEDNAIHESTGESRYVIKHLKRSLQSNPKDFQVAAVDLAVEAHYLSTLRHPHILKLRGMAMDGVDGYRSGRHDGYFLIFDRLEETLDHRLDAWARRTNNMICAEPLTAMVDRLRLEKTRGRNNIIYSEPIKFATQIASAISYLHEHEVIYRDLKPKNIGIDAHGNVKLFDFGFARQLPPAAVVRDVDDTFQMTGRIGTMRYMAPEVALKKPYNLKADVYSWAVIMWQLMAVEKPYKSLEREQYLAIVCKRGKRAKLDMTWPRPIRDLISQCWADSISTRPTMEQVYLALQQEHDCTKAAARQRMPSIVLEFPPAFEIQKREPLTGTTSTATSTTRESTPDCSMVAVEQRFEI